MYFIYLYSENDYKRSGNSYGYWTGKSYIIQGQEYPIIENEIEYKRKEYKSLKRAISGGEIAYDKYGHVSGFDIEDENEKIVYQSYKNSVSKLEEPYDNNDKNTRETIPTIDDSKEWIPREGYSLTLEEIHFLFSEYLNNYSGYDQLETKRTVRDIEELRNWITNAAIKGERL